jgi:hypothetical protein
MYIGTPLHSFEIITAGDITDDQEDGSIQAAMKINQTTLIGKGTLDYCRDTRREILSNRGFVVPQDWELNWIRARGPIWTPDQMAGVAMWCDQRGIFNDTTVTDACTKWANQLDEDQYFSQMYTDDSPYIGTTGVNGFRYLTFDGDNEYMIIPKVRHEDSSAMDLDFNPGAGPSGNTGEADFVVAVACTVRDDNQSAQGIVSNGTTSGWSITADTTSTNQGYNIYHENTSILSSTTGTTGTLQMMVMAKLDGDTHFRLSGQATALYTADNKDCDVNYSLLADEYGYGGLGQAFGTKRWKGDMYELVFARGASVTLADVEKLEGYFLAKYGSSNISLPSGNTTYTEATPPRQGAT